MSAQPTQNITRFLGMIQNEQPRLIRFCQYLTGDNQAAEDLAQETLLIAWQKQEEITDPGGLAHWLTAIARNVCQNWLRRRSREQQYQIKPVQPPEGQFTIEDMLADDFDVTVALERDELATLLDRAMGLLPAETRSLLMQHHLNSLPQTELAERFGLSSGNVAVKLHRGRLALRQVLLENFREDATAYGFVSAAQDVWQRTHIWCFQCGEHRLLAQHDRQAGVLCFKCPECNLSTYSERPFLRQMKAYKPAFKRILADVHDYYLMSDESGVVPCFRCGLPVRLRLGTPPNMPNHHNAIYAWCTHCGTGHGAESWMSLAHSVPNVRQFWQAHPRMHVLKAQTIERDGHPAVITGFKSLTNANRITVIFDLNTFQILHIE